MKSRLIVGTISGVICFALMILEYVLSGLTTLRSLAGNLEWYGAFIILILVVNVHLTEMKKVNLLSLKSGLASSLFVSSLSGLVWGCLSSLYIIYLNPAYPNIMAWRQIPLNPTNEESYVFDVLDALFSPTILPVIKLVFCFIFGFIISLVSATIQTKFIRKQPSESISL